MKQNWLVLTTLFRKCYGKNVYQSTGTQNDYECYLLQQH